MFAGEHYLPLWLYQPIRDHVMNGARAFIQIALCNRRDYFQLIHGSSASVKPLERFPERLNRGFPWRGEYDSSFLLGGGQYGWRSHIRRICVGEWSGRSRAGLPSRKLPSNAASSTSVQWSVDSSSFTGKPAASARPSSAAIRDFALAAHEDLVRQLVAEQPDITLAELEERLAKKKITVGKSSISRFLHHLKLPFKKKSAGSRARSSGRGRRP